MQHLLPQEAQSQNTVRGAGSSRQVPAAELCLGLPHFQVESKPWTRTTTFYHGSVHYWLHDHSPSFRLGFHWGCQRSG